MNRRKYPRYRFKNNSALAVFCLNCTKVYLIDISKHGMKFQLIYRQVPPFKCGDKLSIVFRDNNTNNVVRIRAEVKHVEDGDMVIGCKLLQDDEKIMEVIGCLQKEDIKVRNELLSDVRNKQMDAIAEFNRRLAIYNSSEFKMHRQGGST